MFLYEHFDANKKIFSLHRTNYYSLTHIYWLLKNILLTVLVIYHLQISFTVHIFQWKMVYNHKSNCKWIIKYLTQIVTIPILHQTFVQILINRLFSHKLPIFFYLDRIFQTPFIIFTLFRGNHHLRQYWFF